MYYYDLILYSKRKYISIKIFSEKGHSQRGKYTYTYISHHNKTGLQILNSVNREANPFTFAEYALSFVNRMTKGKSILLSYINK